MNQNCSACGNKLQKMLVTNKGTPRLLLEDELALYHKEKDLDDRYLECKDCGSACLAKTKPVVPRDGHCKKCGGGDKQVKIVPMFTMFQFASMLWTCKDHVMQF